MLCGIDAVAQYAEQGLYNGTVSVSLSVPARAHSSKPAAAGLVVVVVVVVVRFFNNNYDKRIVNKSSTQCKQQCQRKI